MRNGLSHARSVSHALRFAADAGSSDCNSGLVCTQNLPNANGARCCPADLSTAKTPECALSSGSLDANPSPPQEASSSSSGGDATVEAGEAGGDATTESAAGETGPEAGATDGPTEAAEQ